MRRLFVKVMIIIICVSVQLAVTAPKTEARDFFDLVFGLGAEIPSDVYLTSFSCNTDGWVRIEGNSNSSESIYAYMKGLKNRYPDIKMSQLQLAYSDENATRSVYSFIIENATPVQNGQQPEQGEGGENQPPQEQNDNKGLMNNMFPAQQAPQQPAPSDNGNPPPAVPNAPAGLPAPAAP